MFFRPMDKGLYFRIHRLPKCKIFSSDDNRSSFRPACGHIETIFLQGKPDGRLQDNDANVARHALNPVDCFNHNSLQGIILGEEGIIHLFDCSF